MSEIISMIKKQKFYKKILRNKLWVMLIAILAVLDVFWFYPRMHMSAAVESSMVKDEQNARNNGWVSQQGKKFYFNQKGEKQKGAVEIDGKKYYFDERIGYMKTGWIEAGDTKHYYVEDGSMANGEVVIGENHYYFDENGNVVKGWQEIDGKKYYYGEDGKKYFGGHEIDGEQCWFNMETGAYMELDFDPKKPMIALTWDDGPANATAEILDALEAVGGRGTFFVVGNRVDAYADDIKRAVGMGCEIGNHTWEHLYLDTISAEGVVDQLKRTNDKVEELTGIRPALMRPTGGRVNDTLKANVGMPMIYWSLDTLDWKTKNTQSTINAVLNNVKDGDIVLMHDLQETTGEAAKTIIPELVKKGYQLVTVSEMAAVRGGVEDAVLYYDFYPETEETEE